MDTTTAEPTTTAVATAARTVDRFLEAVRTGTGLPTQLFAPDAVLDATVPDWRFAARGAGAVVRQFNTWFDHAGIFEELERLPVPDGEVVTYLLTWVDHGVRHAAHHCHRLHVDPGGRILADRFFCGGRWDAVRLAEMAEANHAG